MAPESNHPGWIFGRNLTGFRNGCLFFAIEYDIYSPEIVFQLVHALGAYNSLSALGVENAAKVRPYIWLEMDKVFVVPAIGDARPAIDRLLKEPTLRVLVRGDTAMS